MTNLIEIVTASMKAVSTGDADWRVQAGAASLLVLAGIGEIVVEKIRHKRKQK